MTRIGYQFQDQSLIELALSHRSVGNDNNERLEFLGDSILGFVVGEALYQKFPKAREGDLSRMRSQLVKGKTLAEVAREFELGDYLNLGPGEMKSGGHRRESILADAVESMIGAIYLDAGMETARERVLSWLASRLGEVTPESRLKDAKTQLQEWMQARKKPLPAYHLRETSGAEHNQLFKVECELEKVGKRFFGEASSRRAAEQAAAQAALNYIQKSL
jgi:ribonuclease-3